MRRISAGAGTIPSRMIPNAAIAPTTVTSTSPMTASPATNLPFTTSSRWIGCDRSRGRVPSARSPLIAVEREGQPEQRRDVGQEPRHRRQRELVADVRREPEQRDEDGLGVGDARRDLADRGRREVQRDGRGQAQHDDEHDEARRQQVVAELLGRRRPSSPTPARSGFAARVAGYGASSLVLRGGRVGREGHGLDRVGRGDADRRRRGGGHTIQVCGRVPSRRVRRRLRRGRTAPAVAGRATARR